MCFTLSRLRFREKFGKGSLNRSRANWSCPVIENPSARPYRLLEQIDQCLYGKINIENICVVDRGVLFSYRFDRGGTFISSPSPKILDFVIGVDIVRRN